MKVFESFVWHNPLDSDLNSSRVYRRRIVTELNYRMKITVVEDHQDLRHLFVEHLASEGFEVSGVVCGEELDELMMTQPVDLLILDINLPGENGFEIARRLRPAHPMMHIIMLTARTVEQDRIRGYDSGADHYLSKPVSPAELTAAVRAVQRRTQNDPSTSDQLALHLGRMSISSAQGEVALSKNDVAVLKALAAAPERRLSYWRIFEVTDRPQNELAKGQLELQVFRLRKKLAQIDVSENLIRSEGYQLTEPIQIIA